MPIANADLLETSPSPEPRSEPQLELPFPPVTKSHILNCSYHSWYLRYRSFTPKARLIPLSASFLSYLRADGIILPPEATSSSTDFNLDNEKEEEQDEAIDPSEAWLDIHHSIKSTISELGGSVMPKLNWSAPKDATWISATNSMACVTPNDIYLLLKSSDFITHDLEQVFDDCEDESEGESENAYEDEDESSVDDTLSKIPYHLVLRKTVPAFNPALEIRCFVRSRHLLCMCQRDLNHFDFLPRLIPKLRSLIQNTFDKSLKRSFPDENFVFDVYIPPPHDRVWLIDVNPWAPRTDPLLYSWMEILNMRGEEQGDADKIQNGVVQISLNGNDSLSGGSDLDYEQDEEEDEESEYEEQVFFTPEFRLVNRDDPEAYNFNTPQYSAHKLPKDVVDASADGEAGLREFMGTWRETVARQEKEDREDGEIKAIELSR